MLTQQQVSESLDNPMKGIAKFRVAGITLTLAGLLVGTHAGYQLVELFAGHPLQVPILILYVEAGLAMVLGLTGFGMLVAGAEPFDETEEAPMLKYDNETRDPLE